MRYLCRIILLYCCFVLCWNISAQNEGKEFWFTDGISGARNEYSFPGQALDSAIIYVLGRTHCTGYIENPYTQYHVDFEVMPGMMTKIVIPEEVMTPLNYENISLALVSCVMQGGTIVIRTTQKVQVWVQTYNCPRQADINDYYGYPLGYEGYAYKLALCPTDMHSTNYDKNTWVSNLPIFAVATEDNTYLYLENDTVLLNQGEVYFSPTGCDIHTNCKKIIVYKGNLASLVGSLHHQYCYKGFDYLFRVPEKKSFGMEVSVGDNDIPTLLYPNENWQTDIAVYHNPFHYYHPYDIEYDSSHPYYYDSVPYAYIRYLQEPGKAWPYLTNKVFSNRYYINSHGGWIAGHPHITPAQPAELMVSNWSWPISKNTYNLPSVLIDTTYVILTVYVHEDGIGSTYLNGQLVPASAFDSFPGTNGEYYSAQWDWENVDTFPDYITLENSHGFSAYIHEIGYSYLPSGYSYVGNTMHPAYYMYGTSGFEYRNLPIPHSNLSAINYDTVHRCLGDTLALLVEHNPDSVPVEWIVDGVSHFGDAHSFLLAELTTHAVQCVLHYECPDTTTTFVAVVPPPFITVAHDTTVCRGATLSVEQPDAISYLWSNGATTPSVSVDSAGTFQVSVTNIGCRAESDSFHVSLYGQSAVDFGNDSTLCELATLLLDATQPHPAEYLWQDNSTNTSYLVYRDGEYWVVVTDRCLGASDTVHIGYLSDFAVSLGPDTTLCEGRTLVLSPGVEHCDYLWQDGSAQPVYVVRGPGTYSVEVSNRCFSHWDAVDVDYESCAQELYLPNAFSPDGNGLNEVFLPVFAYPDEVEEYRMEIYNRWGTLVFRSEEKTFGWDGRNAPSGVYAVKIYYKTRGDVSRTVTGNVTVVR